MKWADYRERLGLGFDDKSKFEALRNKFCNFASNIGYANYSLNDCCEYFTLVGEAWDPYNRSSSLQLKKSFQLSESMEDLISKYIAFYNSYKVEKYDKLREDYKKYIWNFFDKSLKDLKIPYELISDEDGLFIFPKGVPEFDESLVSKPLSWLKKYPQAEKAWSGALRDYSEKSDNPSQVADGFRKALEAFFQEFFELDKSLENILPDYCTYLKNCGIPAEISDNFRKILDAYTKFNNNYAKHHDRATSNVLEYIMYATGNIIRLVITLKGSDESKQQAAI
ncbi:hypothetical protein [Fibrobacter sp.]|uniref:hypothetical protein n=1 Tax=Fibrobacter sp. TaxID=35828 RepID=UPI003866CFD7